jgi:hypothetical protein
MDDFDFDFGSGDDFDISSFLGDDGGSSGIDLSGIDLGPEAFDLSSLLSGDSGIDLSGIDLGPEAFDIASLMGSDGIDFGSLDAGEGAFDLSALLNAEGGEESLSRSLGSKRISLADLEKDTSGGTGLKSTGRGQLSMVDPVTGATGITGEGFNSLKDLLGSGTAEEIARYSPETVDYSLRSGLETEGGQGFNADSTRGMSLEQMGGGQGLSKYIPAQYSESVLTDLVKNNPGAFPEIEKYLDSQYDKAGLTPFKGTGGTLSETGFLAQSSAANPLGSKYSLGDPKSFINNPTVTGQQSVVSPGRTIIDNKDGTYKVVTNTIDGTKTITTDRKGVDTIINNTRGGGGGGSNTPTKPTDKKDNNMLLALLALMALMNKGGGSSTSSAVIPSLTADRKQLPYGPASGSKARPGAGGVTYFSPTTYSQRAAGGGMMYGGGGLSDLGSYSDGGRLLKGPGDGVSDSIPATIGGKQPARLATGEFVVPARIVSELGNGSTEAGAKKLYAMMDRVQKARRKTKNVAADTKAHKYLPA